MRTTIRIDDDLLVRARELTGIERTTDLMKAALKSLIAREAARRLALLGGTLPEIDVQPRQRANVKPRDPSNGDGVQRRDG